MILRTLHHAAIMAQQANTVYAEDDRADRRTRTGNHGFREIRVNQLVQVMHEEALLVGRLAGVRLEPLLDNREGAWPRAQLDGNAPGK